MREIANNFCMRKRLFLFGFLLACVLLTSACSVSEMSTLADLSKPYTGIYECELLQYGDKDYTEHFEYLRLELKYGGEAVLSYKEKKGGGASYRATYSADPEAGEITLSAQVGLSKKSYTFPFKKGKIYVDYPLQGKLLHAVFAMP